MLRFSPGDKATQLLSLATSAGGETAIYLSDTDRIVARANESIQALQSDLGSANAADAWKVIASCSSSCIILQSPSRRTLLLDSSDAESSLRLIDTWQLSAVRQCERGTYPVQSITDKFAYYSGWDPRDGYFAYHWPLCDFEHRTEMTFDLRGRYTILNNDSFVMNAEIKTDKDRNRNLQVISGDGQVKFRQAMADNEVWSNLWVPIRSSERGDRIAVDVLTLRGGNRTLDISSHVTARRIAVYDIEAGKEVASIPVNPKHRYRYEFDLSPDGKRLAVLEDDTVKVVDLEPRSAPTL